MTSKLRRAVDATLEKYDAKLGFELGYVTTYETDCQFCMEYSKSTLCEISCGSCPIDAVEPDCTYSWGDRCYGILNEIDRMGGRGDIIPAILAVMIYLHGFVEE